MKQARSADNDAGDDGNGPKGVRDTAVVLEAFDGPGKLPENIEVGGFGGQHRGESGVGRLAIEAGAPDAGAGEEMCEGLHRVALPSPLASAHQRLGGAGHGNAVDVELR